MLLHEPRSFQASRRTNCHSHRVQASHPPHLFEVELLEVEGLLGLPRASVIDSQHRRLAFNEVNLEKANKKVEGGGGGKNKTLPLYACCQRNSVHSSRLLCMQLSLFSPYVGGGVCTHDNAGHTYHIIVRGNLTSHPISG